MTKRDDLIRTLDAWTENALKTHGRFDTAEMVDAILDELMEPGGGAEIVGQNAAAWEVGDILRGTDDDGPWITPTTIKFYPRAVWQAMLTHIKDGKS